MQGEIFANFIRRGRVAGAKSSCPGRPRLLSPGHEDFAPATRRPANRGKGPVRPSPAQINQHVGKRKGLFPDSSWGGGGVRRLPIGAIGILVRPTAKCDLSPYQAENQGDERVNGLMQVRRWPRKEVPH